MCNQGKKIIMRVWSLILEQSKGNNHTSKINVFHVSHTTFYLLGSQKMDLFALHGTIKSTLWPVSRKTNSWIGIPNWHILWIGTILNVTYNICYLKILHIKIIYWVNKCEVGSFLSDTARKINSVFGEGLTRHSTVSFWFAKFCSGDLSLENKPRGIPQSKVNNDEIKAIVESDTSQTTRDIASKFGASIPTILDRCVKSRK